MWPSSDVSSLLLEEGIAMAVAGDGYGGGNRSDDTIVYTGVHVNITARVRQIHMSASFLYQLSSPLVGIIRFSRP